VAGCYGIGLPSTRAATICLPFERVEENSQIAKLLFTVSCLFTRRVAHILCPVGNFAFCEYLNRVHVLSKSAWRDAVVRDHTLEGPISEWYKIASCATWKNITDVKAVYPHRDFVDPFTVFNIKGNHYRLVVKIEYRWKLIFVKHLLTHEEYDKGAWRP
jgi:mRNA interferase HigB